MLTNFSHSWNIIAVIRGLTLHCCHLALLTQDSAPTIETRWLRSCRSSDKVVFLVTELLLTLIGVLCLLLCMTLDTPSGKYAGTGRIMFGRHRM